MHELTVYAHKNIYCMTTMGQAILYILVIQVKKNWSPCRVYISALLILLIMLLFFPHSSFEPSNTPLASLIFLLLLLYWNVSSTEDGFCLM